jgi:NADH dehydrogenase
MAAERASPGPGGEGAAELRGSAVAVTGATGLIGRQLCERLAAAGNEVRALVRKTEPYPFVASGIRVHHCDLPDAIDPAAFAGADAVVHCAYMTRFTDLESARRVNDLGTRRVLELARAAGVPRFLFLSSQSAHEEAQSFYGRSKLALEKLLAPGDIAFRSGLVVAREGSGLFHRMLDMVRKAKAIPLFGGGRQPIQTIHVDDLVTAIAAALARGLAGVYSVSEPRAITFRELLEKIAAHVGRRPLFVPFPMAPALLFLRAVEKLRVPFPVSSENLLGLKCLRAWDTAPDLARLGVRVRSVDESLAEVV